MIGGALETTGGRQARVRSLLAALRRGGYLHDLAKVAIPDATLLKNGPLTPEERDVPQRGPWPYVGNELEEREDRECFV